MRRLMNGAGFRRFSGGRSGCSRFCICRSFRVQTISVIDAAWKLSLVFSAIGLFTRFSNATAFVLCVYLFGLPNSFGKTHHLDILLLWTFLIMTFSRCGDSWSVDRLIKTARNGSDRGSEPAKTQRGIHVADPVDLGDHGDDLFRGGRFEVAAFGPGLGDGKLDVDFPSNVPIPCDGRRAAGELGPVDRRGTDGRPICWRRWGCRLTVLSAGAVQPAAAISRHGQRDDDADGDCRFDGAEFLPDDPVSVAVASAGSNPVLVSWLVSRGKEYAVIFDGSCGLCKKTIAVVKSLDLLSRVEYLDAVNRWPEIQKRFPNLDQVRCLEDMHAVSGDGKVRAWGLRHTGDWPGCCRWDGCCCRCFISRVWHQSARLCTEWWRMGGTGDRVHYRPRSVPDRRIPRPRRSRDGAFCGVREFI